MCVWACLGEAVPPYYSGQMELDEVSWVFESSGQGSNWQRRVPSSRLPSQGHALLKATELKINMEPGIDFSPDVLYYMFHTLNSFTSLLYSPGSSRTNIEVGKKKGNCPLPSTLPILSEWLTSTGTINLDQDGMTAGRRHPQQSPLVPKTWGGNQLLPCAAVGAIWNYLVVLKIAFYTFRAPCICRMGSRSGVVKCCANHQVWAGTFNSVGWNAIQAMEPKRSTPPPPGRLKPNNS